MIGPGAGQCRSMTGVAPAMRMADLLTPAGVVLDVRATDKRRLLDEAARRAAPDGLDPAAVLGALAAREQLGSTGIGDGIAIPHARFVALDRPSGLFLRLKTPIDFDSIDGRRVDLVFLLMMPAHAQGVEINALACVARHLRDARTAAALRAARDPHAAYAILTEDDRLL